MKILMTSGGTREPIDGVRFISNFSTGSTGALICDYLRQKGYEVTFLYGRDSKLPESYGENIEFVSFSDLEELLRFHLGSRKFNAMIHLAAISDYSVDKIIIGDNEVAPSDSNKLNSDAEQITLRLKKNTKLINQLKKFSENKDFLLIGFKLTNTKTQDEQLNAVEKLSENFDIDYIVHNDLSDISSGKHLTHIYKAGGHPKLFTKTNTKNELAETLEKIIKESK